jgi:hypothetical protein
MNREISPHSLFSRSALAGLIVIGVLGSVPARAEDPIEGFLGMLGLKPTEDTNNYPERAPLVVPPNKKLPKPKTLTSAADPAWPKDPDVLKKQADEAEASAPVAKVDSSKALTLEEATRVQKGASRAALSAPVNRNELERPLTPQEMAAASEIMKQVVANNAASANGGKSYLTDPPAAVKKKAVITPEIEAATKAATGEGKPWYQLW